MDHMKAEGERPRRGASNLLWTLQVLDEAAEQGLINDLTAEARTPGATRRCFYIGDKGPGGHRGHEAAGLAAGSRAQEQDRKAQEQAAPQHEPTPEPKKDRKHGRGFGRGM